METRGERLKGLRTARKMSQSQLAEELGVTKANVSKWESRASPNIDLDVFFKLAKFFDVDARELATGRPETPSATPDIPARRLSLIRLYGTLPDELRMPIRSLIETLATAGNERYAKYSWEEAERVKKRDRKKPQPA